MNHSDLQHLPTPDRETIRGIREMLNQRAFQEAESAAQILLESTAGVESRRDKVVRLEAAGLLIDIGAEGKMEAAVRRGLSVLESDRGSLGALVTADSYEYNLGNAQMALYEIARAHMAELPTVEETEVLVRAKNHFWRSVRAMGTVDRSYRDQVLTNLASALFLSGRVVEALDYLDQVLLASPDFPYARHHRGKSLRGLARITGCPTARLIHEAMKDFEAAAQSTEFPPGARDQSEHYRRECEAWLQRRGRAALDSDRETRKRNEEEKKHSPFRRWCLKQHLALSEHALYCRCAGARRDDLMVAIPSAKLSGNLVPRMELYLNRVKSEFAYARWLFYASAGEKRRHWNLYDREVTFTELFEGECVGMAAEMLRASLRHCFGILDKIAMAVCELLDLASCSETLYFESFWRPRGKAGNDHPRWQKLKRFRIAPLLALYSAATDLNQSNGEWGDYKKWRNELEHRMLLLIEPTDKVDPFGALAGRFLITHMPVVEFRDRALHLLRLTRAAIFNLAFCARSVSQDAGKGGGRSLLVTLTRKSEDA
jgi:hypothetical protein